LKTFTDMDCVGFVHPLATPMRFGEYNNLQKT